MNDATSVLIVEDDKYIKDDELSGVVYLLDVNEVENLKRSDYEKSKLDWVSRAYGTVAANNFAQSRQGEAVRVS